MATVMAAERHARRMVPREQGAVARADGTLEAVYLRTVEQLADGGQPGSRPGRRWSAVVGLGLVLGLSGLMLYWTSGRPVPDPSAVSRSLPGARRAAAPDPPRIVEVAPAGRKIRLRVGEERSFTVRAQGEDLLYRWAVDGKTAGMGDAWVFRPDGNHIGRRRVEVSIFGATGTRSRLWTVRVEPPRPPRLVSASPPADTLEAQAGSSLMFQVTTRPGSDGKTLQIAWLLDGARVGRGERLNLRVDKPGTSRLEAIAVDDRNSRIMREWRIAVVAPPAPPAVEATVPQPEAQPRVAAASERQDRVSALGDRDRMLKPDVPPPPQAMGQAVPTVSRQEIDRLLERYAQAWRSHDVLELQRIGQVTSPAQAAALADYFRRTGEIEVEVRLLDVIEADGELRVRFVRRDRFRDPLGRMVSKESPPLEKLLAKSADGLRFAAPTH